MTARLRGLIEMPVGNGHGGGGAQGLPESNVLEMRLAGGSRVLVRPSGVEPKIKAYAFARGAAEEARELLDVLSADVRDVLN